MVRSEIVGRADNYRGIFTTIWDTVGKQLLQAKSKEDVIEAFESEAHYKSEFAPIAGLILNGLFLVATIANSALGAAMNLGAFNNRFNRNNNPWNQPQNPPPWNPPPAQPRNFR